MLELVPPCPRVIYELGSGWGGLAIKLAKKFPKAQVYAFELSFFPWFFSLLLKKIYLINNLTISRKNFFCIPLRDADAIVCFLYPKAMQQLNDKFQKELKKGCFVISNSFSLPGWKATHEMAVNDLWTSTIYKYKV